MTPAYSYPQAITVLPIHVPLNGLPSWANTANGQTVPQAFIQNAANQATGDIVNQAAGYADLHLVDWIAGVIGLLMVAAGIMAIAKPI